MTTLFRKVCKIKSDRLLASFANSRTLPHALVQRARIILAADSGQTNIKIAKEVQLSRENVGKWRKRYAKYGLPGIYDQLRTGRPRTIDDEQIAKVISATINRKPEEETHWSTRSLAEQTGLSKSTIQRVWKAFGLQPHRQKYFKLSNDPFFIEKVYDIVGLYLNPPENAMVLCVDEKSQCQALERTQPLLPIGLGYAEGVSLCTSKCTIFLRFKMYHLEMLISLILSVCFVENFMAVCLRFC